MNMVIFGNFLSEIIGISSIVRAFPIQDNPNVYVFGFTVYTKANSINFQSRIFQHPEKHSNARTAHEEQDALTYQLQYCEYFVKIYDHFWEKDDSLSLSQRDEDLKTVMKLQERSKNRKLKLDQIVLSQGGGQDDGRDQVYN